MKYLIEAHGDEHFLRNYQLLSYEYSKICLHAQLHYRIYKSLSLIPILSENNPVHTGLA
jgi:hypothetical protein